MFKVHRSLAVVLGVSCLVGCHLGYHYRHGNTTYVMTTEQSDYYERASREIVATGDRLRASGAADDKVFEARCRAYDGYIGNAPGDWASNRTPAKKLLELDRAKDCDAALKAQKAEDARVAEEAEQDAEKEQQAHLVREKRARIEQELSTGRCTEMHARAFEEILVRRIPMAKRAMESDGPIDIGPKKLFVASQVPATFEFQATLGGLYNVFAIGVDEVEITAAHDGSGAEVTASSVYEMPNLFVSPFLDSRVVRAQPYERLSVTLAGRGCVLVIAMNQVGQ